MEQRNYLGIYTSQSGSTAVILRAKGSGFSVLGCFSLKRQTEDEGANYSSASAIAGECAKRDIAFSEIVVALDCAQITQHNLNVGFTDPKQIAQTIRFDAEEALATDTSDLAIAFNITKTDASGSSVTVFASEKKLLADSIAELQANNMDPVTIEPDSICLARYLQQTVATGEKSNALFAIISARTCYLITFSRGTGKANVRTFFVGSSQNITEVLARQIRLTTASMSESEPPNLVMVTDTTGKVDCDSMREKLGFEIQSFDLAEAANIEPDQQSEYDSVVDFAIACGASFGQLSKGTFVNFRSDFMPYQGRKLLIQKTLKILSISVTALMIIVGLYFQLQVFKTNRYVSRLHKKVQKQYAAVMFDKKIPSEGAVSKLGREVTKIQKIKSGLLSAAGEESVSAKLTFVLEAFNKAPKNINLKIDTITISAKTITIVGNTNARPSTLKLFDSVKKHPKLKMSQSTYELKSGRDKFRITVLPE